MIKDDDFPEDFFLTRWSRLKREHKQDTRNSTSRSDHVETRAVNTKAVVTAADQAATDQAVTGQAATDQYIAAVALTDDDMPDIDTLTADSDYSEFLSSGVSDALRKAALRKLFHCEVFNVCDGLDDYDDDYTQFKNLGSIVTSDMRHQIELKAQRIAEQVLQEQQLQGQQLQGQQLSSNEGITADIEITSTGTDQEKENLISLQHQDTVKTDVQAELDSVDNNTNKNNAS